MGNRNCGASGIKRLVLSPTIIEVLASPSKDYMQGVTGIGRFFFRAKDPSAVAGWYKEHLGVDLAPAEYNQRPWSQEGSPTFIAPFPIDTDYFGNQGKPGCSTSASVSFEPVVQPLRR